MNAQDKLKIKSLPGNKKCVDCQTPNPTWGSVSHGTLHCFECIGKHRGLGVHISFARSMDLDSWDEKQLTFMGIIGNGSGNGSGNDNAGNDSGNDNAGNDRFITFMQQQNSNIQFSRANIRNVYDNQFAELYRAKLKAKVEGRPEPTMDDFLKHKSSTSSSARSRQQYTNVIGGIGNTTNAATNTPSAGSGASTGGATSTRSTLSSRLMISTKPTKTQRFIAGFKYYSYKLFIIPIKTHNIASISTFILYLTSKITLHKTSILNKLFQCIIYSISSTVLLLSLCSIHWFNIHRHESYTSSTNHFLSRMNEGKIKRNPTYDIYFPKDATIGSTISKAILFYPESLIDITSYSIMISKLSDAGILVIVMNFNPTRVVTPYTHGGKLNDCFKVVYEIEKLMGMNVGEWVLGGHGDGANIALEIRRCVALQKMKTKGNLNTNMRCILWGLSTSPRRFFTSKSWVSLSSSSSSSKSSSFGDKLFVTTSNDLIAGNLRFEKNTRGATDADADTALSYASYYNIEDGNHSGFGHYGPQTFPRKDGNCVKTIDLQQKECCLRTLDFVFEREPSLGSKKKD